MNRKYKEFDRVEVIHLCLSTMLGFLRTKPTNQCEGNKIIEDAKIGGITPAMLSLSGR